MSAAKSTFSMSADAPSVFASGSTWTSFEVDGAARELHDRLRAANHVVADRDLRIDVVGEAISIDANAARGDAPAHFGELHARGEAHVRVDADPTFDVRQLREPRRRADGNARADVTAHVGDLAVLRDLDVRVIQLELDAPLIVRPEPARRRRELARIEIGRARHLEAANRDVVGREANARVERADRVFVERVVAVTNDVALAARRATSSEAPRSVSSVCTSRSSRGLARARRRSSGRLAVGDRERVERKVNRPGVLLVRLLRLEREVLELAVLHDDARVRRVDVDLVDEELAAHQREKIAGAPSRGAR